MRVSFPWRSFFWESCCPICGLAIEGKGPCDGCKEEAVPLSAPQCSICSRALLSEKWICCYCRRRRYFFSQNYSLYAYAGLVKEALHRYKFDGIRQLAYWFAWDLFVLLERRFPGETVVPVPSRALADQKMDAVEELAHILREHFGVSVWKGLERLDKTPQKGLGYRQRLKHLSGKIRISQKEPFLSSSERPLLLLDDVLTTGSTASECARVLLSAGCCSSVSVVTVAIS